MANVPLLPSQLQKGTPPTPSVPLSPTQLKPGNPVGVQAVSPTNNIPQPSNSLPSSQIAPKDLSGTYANVGGTIYNKNSQTKFSNEGDFFKDSGLSSFNNVKFDMGYNPSGKETIYGQQLPTTVTPPPVAPAASNPAPVTTPPASTAPYTPPNQGTTGVSQGGIIGNLIGTANNQSPAVQKAISDIKALSESQAKSEADLDSEPIDLSLASGSKGILSRLFAAKSGAAQTALQNALTEQGQGITATTAAGNLNAPVTNPQTGGLVSPSSNTTLGATTSGATNISSLIGTRADANGKANGEYYNTQTGQGFSNPQQLADFINKQLPGANATAANVFDLLKSGALNGGGGNSALNPIANVSSVAQQVISGQISPSQAYSMGGTVANWQTLLNNELQKQQPGFDTSSAEAKYAANQTTQTTQAQQKAQWQSAYSQGQNLQAQVSDLISKFGLNPNDINAVNVGLQVIAKNTSDARYQILSNYINDIANTYAQILTPTGGSQTDTTRSIASSMLDATAKGTSIITTMKSLDAAAQAKIAGVQTPSTTNTPTTPSSGGTWNW